MTTSIYIGGELSRRNEVKTYPQLEATNITPKAIILEDQSIPICVYPYISPAAFNTIISYCVSRFCNLQDHHNIKQFRLLACLAGIIANCSNFRGISLWPAMKAAFKTAGINLIIESKT